MANELRKCYSDLSRSEEKEQQLWDVGCFERDAAPQKVPFKCVGHALSVVTLLGAITPINHAVFSAKSRMKKSLGDTSTFQLAQSVLL